MFKNLEEVYVCVLLKVCVSVYISVGVYFVVF